MKKKRNEIKVQLMEGNNISNDKKPDIESFDELVKKGSLPDKISRPGFIISKVDYPITVEYGDDQIRVSPRARLQVGNLDKVKVKDGIVLKALSN